MRVSVIVFPGSNCDHDIEHLYREVLQQKVSSIWHRENDLQNPDLVVVPGGFSYGDYLRPGAVAKISPVMEEIRKFALGGGPVIGICNGFQILCEVGLLPGVLLQNIQRRFLSRFVSIKLESEGTPFTRELNRGDIITCPIAHNEGNYFADADTIKRLEDEERVVFRYCSPDGRIDNENLDLNPNGSVNSIAGICNEAGNVIGMMPHPERAAEGAVGYVGLQSGRALFESVLAA